MAESETCSADSGLAWLWTIEYLASFEHIDPSILRDLINEAPELPGDLGKSAREMVALKCLEHLSTSSSNPKDLDQSCMSTSNANQKVMFDVNESCEHVLQSVLKEASVSDQNTTEPDLLKWDIRSFIMQKRASLPKCYLQQLKDAILKGTHPCAASLRERSGLMLTYGEDDRITVDCGTNNNGTDIHIVLERSNITFPVENTKEMVRGDSHLKSSLPLKRNGDDLDNEHHIGDCREDKGGANDGDCLLNAKRSKTYEFCGNNKSEERILIPQSDNDEFGENSFEVMIGVSEKESCCVETNSQVELGECCILNEGHDKFVAEERLGRNPTDANDEFKNMQSENEHLDNEMLEDTFGQGINQCINEAEAVAPQGTSHKVSVDGNRNNHVVSSHGFHRRIAVEKLETSMDILYQEDTSSESDGRIHEKFDVAEEKSNFLSSHCSLSHVSPSNWTELTLCVKCSRDGHLLVCNAVGCPFVVHEKCLGCSPEFDDERNFYCPFCAYAFAISKYLEAKEKAARGRKALAAFIRKCPENRLHKIHECGDLGMKEFVQTSNKEHPDIANRQLKKRIGDDQSEEPLLSCTDITLLCREGRDVSKVVTLSLPEANEREEIALKSPPERVLDRRNDILSGLSCDQKKFLSNKRDVEGRNWKEQTLDLLEKHVCDDNVDKGEASDNKNEGNVISDRSIRVQRREMREQQYVCSATPQLRRKKVPWTAKEEEILKEGVQKFSVIGQRTIPWKIILKYGSSVFSTDRTTIDLKDKWRNICKRSPKCK